MTTVSVFRAPHYLVLVWLTKRRERGPTYSYERQVMTNVEISLEVERLARYV